MGIFRRACYTLVNPFVNELITMKQDKHTNVTTPELNLAKRILRARLFHTATKKQASLGSTTPSCGESSPTILTLSRQDGVRRPELIPLLLYCEEYGLQLVAYSQWLVAIREPGSTIQCVVFDIEEIGGLSAFNVLLYAAKHLDVHSQAYPEMIRLAEWLQREFYQPS